MWGRGRYQRITETIPDIHALVIERLAPAPGERWLDLACGTGAVAELAAGAGAGVTGIDLAPALIETARTRAPARDQTRRPDRPRQLDAGGQHRPDVRDDGPVPAPPHPPATRSCGATSSTSGRCSAGRSSSRSRSTSRRSGPRRARRTGSCSRPASDRRRRSPTELGESVGGAAPRVGRVLRARVPRRRRDRPRARVPARARAAPSADDEAAAADARAVAALRPGGPRPATRTSGSAPGSAAGPPAEPPLPLELQLGAGATR